MSKNVVIKAEHLSKEYTIYKKNIQKLKAAFFGNGKGVKRVALTDVSFEIEKGERVAIIGRLGSGRSTLLKLIAGITFPTSGKVTVTEKVEPILDLKAGFDGELSGRMNIYVKGAIHGHNKADIKEHEQEIIEFAGLEEYIDLPIKSYAPGKGGMLGFTVQTTFKPEILLMDENFAVGNRMFKDRCIERLKMYAEMDDVTFVMVTKNFQLAKYLCTRAIVIEKGELLFDGDIDEAIKFYRANVKNSVGKTEEEEMEDRAIQMQLEDDEEFDEYGMM